MKECESHWQSNFEWNMEIPLISCYFRSFLRFYVWINFWIGPLLHGLSGCNGWKLVFIVICFHWFGIYVFWYIYFYMLVILLDIILLPFVALILCISHLESWLLWNACITSILIEIIQFRATKAPLADNWMECLC